MELKVKVSKKTWKRWLAAILSICLCLSCLQVPVLAQGEVQGVEKEQIKKAKKKSEVAAARYYAPVNVNSKIAEDATELILEQEQQVFIQNGGEEKWFKFTPEENGKYYFFSNSNTDTKGALYEVGEDGLLYLMIENDDADLGHWSVNEEIGNDLDFVIDLDLTANKTYYLSTWLYDEEEVGEYAVKVSKDTPASGLNDEMVKDAKIISKDTEEIVSINNPGTVQWFKFIPDDTDEYVLYSRSDEGTDTYVSLYLYDDMKNYQFINSNDDGALGENHLDFRMEESLEQGKTYYICTSMLGQSDTGSFYVGISTKKEVNKIRVKEVKPYSSILAYKNLSDDSYGKITFEIGYEGTDEIKELSASFDDSYLYDIYGNYIWIGLKDSSLETNWRRKYQGNYEFIANLCTYYGEIKKSLNFTRTINSFRDYGKTASDIQYGKEMSVSSGTQIFEFTAQENGNHVISYSSGLEDSYIYVYNASENRADWKYGDNNTRYGKLIKGNKYYIVVQSYPGDSGTIKLNYYNGATNPNAAPKPSTPSTSTPSTNVPKAPSVSNKSTGIPATGISVAKKSIALKKGGKIKLSTIVSPLNSTDSVTFTSSKPKVAKVSGSGVVKAKKPGKAKITIRTTSGKMVTVTVKVTKKAVKATKVSVKKKIKIKKGTVRFLSYKVNPKNSTDKMKWKSSKKGVVSVDNNGKITAKKKGKAVITVKIGNKKASCKVTVK